MFVRWMWLDIFLVVFVDIFDGFCVLKEIFYGNLYIYFGDRVEKRRNVFFCFKVLIGMVLF